LTIQTIAVLDCTLPVVSVRVVSYRFKPGFNLTIIDPFTRFKIVSFIKVVAILFFYCKFSANKKTSKSSLEFFV